MVIGGHGDYCRMVLCERCVTIIVMVMVEDLVVCAYYRKTFSEKNKLMKCNASRGQHKGRATILARQS